MGKDDPVDFATMEPRPGSAMSECSIQLPGDVSQCHSRPGSRMDQMLGDELSRSLLDLTTSGNLRASPAHNASYSAAGFHRAKICWMTWTWRSIWEKRPPQSEKRKPRRAEKQQRPRRRRFEQTQRECSIF